MSEIDGKVLDVRRKKESEAPSQERATTREHIFDLELNRALDRYAEHIAESSAARHERANFPGASRSFADRTVESTYHPSQIGPTQQHEALAPELKRIRDAYEKSREDPSIVFDAKSEARESSLRIMAKIRGKIPNLANAAIQSNAALRPEEISEIQSTLVSNLASLLGRKERQTGWSRDKNLVQLTQSVTDEDLRREIESITIEQPQDRFDESRETVLEAKTILLNNVAEDHHVWVDFDGARRAAGHIYSKYGALVYEDIVRNLHQLTSKEFVRVIEAYTAFRGNASLNHAISTMLQDPSSIDPGIVPQLEHTMDVLKEDRSKQLESLISVLDDIKQKNKAEEVNDVVYLSDRVKFMPRLDHRTIQEAAKAQFNWTKRPYEPEVSVDQAPINLLQNILSQVLEINRLAKRTVIPEVMIAMANNAEDVLALEAELDYLRRVKAKAGEGDVSAKISLVPLFESEETVSGKQIGEYLEKMWRYFNNMYGKDGPTRFRESINEIFIAGSDLSKEIGQTTALAKAWDVSMTVAEFNRKYDTDVRVKLGTGEAPFRQGGLWDPEGYLPMVRGKILDYTPLSDEAAKRAEEERVVKEAEVFLQTTFGEKWREQLQRKPRGFNRLFRLFPFNSFTNQSRSKELTMTNIDTPRLRRMRREAEATHDDNMRRLTAGDFPSPPSVLKDAARFEQEFYQKIFGSAGGEKSLFGRLLQFCAKSLPALELRDRGHGRARTAEDPAAFFNDLKKPFIDARAISANTVSGYLFPLYLVGKGSMLEAASTEGAFAEVMQYVDAKELLRQMKVYGEIAEDIFAMLREQGMTEDATLLSAEWNRLVALRSSIQEEMWRQESPAGVDFTKLDASQKAQLAQYFVPGMRELLEDDFPSDRTTLFRQNFEEHKGIIQAAVTYVAAGYGLSTTSLEEAENMRKAITDKEYGTFLANVVTAYSPGM